MTPHPAPRPDSTIYVAGHRGLVGSAIVRRLAGRGYTNIVTATRAEVDLLDRAAVAGFVAEHRPEYVFLAAATVGGIMANKIRPVQFLEDNVTIQTNVMSAASRNGIGKLMFLGSSCIYPRECPQPIREEYLLTGPLEETNQWYALAKITGLKQALAYRQEFGVDYVSVMPCNLYGPGDNFNLESSHVIPGLMRRLDAARDAKARSIELWGTGTPRREFLFVDDLADACVTLMETWSDDAHLNVGTGTDVTIAELARQVADVVGYPGELRFDATHPDGTPRKVLDVSRLFATGWRPKVNLAVGLRQTYAWFQQHRAELP